MFTTLFAARAQVGSRRKRSRVRMAEVLQVVNSILGTRLHHRHSACLGAAQLQFGSWSPGDGKTLKPPEVEPLNSSTSSACFQRLPRFSGFRFLFLSTRQPLNLFCLL